MRLLKTIEKLIKESEELYDYASEFPVRPEELDKIEEKYQESLKLLKLYKNLEKKRNIS